MTKFVVILIVLTCSLVAYVAAAHVPIEWVLSGDYNSHVTNYRPECETILKRYMPDERKQHMTYHEYTVMIDALKACNAHATPGLAKQWVWQPIPK